MPRGTPESRKISIPHLILFLNMDLPEITLMNLVSTFASSCIIFGGVVPYIPQYFDIKRSGNAEGFSTYVCLTLLIANTLRIFFWFGHNFELPLLLQSIVMIFTMLAVMNICTAVRAKAEIIPPKPRIFTDSEQENSTSHGSEAKPEYLVKHRRSFMDLDMAYFWKWTDFASYVEFLLTLSALVGLVTYFLLNVTVYIEGLGFMAVLFEALLGAPQFYRNYQKKSTQGMSLKMVLMWTMGDVFKTVYFVLKHAPAQFWICGTLQISLDIAIILQVLYYSKAKPSSQ